MKQLSSNNLNELYTTKLFEVNWMIIEKLWERNQNQHGTNCEQGAYYMNLLLPEVEVSTNKLHTVTEKHKWPVKKYLANYTNSYKPIIIEKNKWDRCGCPTRDHYEALEIVALAVQLPTSSVSAHFIYHRKRKKSHHPKIEIIQIHSYNL